MKVGKWQELRFRCGLPRGIYIVSIEAKDAAGNRDWSWARLSVR